MRNWLPLGWDSVPSARPAVRPSRRFRPCLERLELRDAPAVQVFQSFEGLDRTQSGGLTPPDTIGVITPTHAVEMTNVAIGFYDRTDGNLDFLQLMTDFYDDVRGSTFLFDPICIYDEVAGRIILIAHDRNSGAERSWFDIAVSNTSNPLDGFTEMHAIEVTELNLAGNDTVWGDNAKVGQTADAIIISANMFGFNSGFSHTSIISISKASLYDQNVGTLSFFDINRAGFFSTIPANMHGAAAGGSAWFVMNGGTNDMRLTRMDNVLSATPTFADFTVGVPAHNAAPAFRQPGGTITSFDQRVLTVGWRGNRLVAAHQIGVGGAARARWYEFDTTNASSPTLRQSGNVNPGANSLDTYFPAIDLNANLDIGISYMQSGTTEFMSCYVTGRRANDPLGTLQAGVKVGFGVGNHTSGRAGDYGGIGIDPLNPNRFWGFNEFAKAAGSLWGTWIAEFEIIPEVRAVADGFSVNEDTVLNIAAPGLLFNDTTIVGPLSATLETGPANGIAVVNANGSFTYTPNLNFFGADTFTYRATSGAFFDIGTVTITVNPVNDDPFAVADGVYFVEAGTTLNVAAALGVLANDSDPDGDPLTAVNFTAPSKGILTPNANGSFTYQANAGATGTDTFTYRATDGTGFSAVTTVTLLLNNRPVAQPNNYSTLWNTTLIVSGSGVLGNDLDLDGDPLTAELVTSTTNGTLNFLSSGGFTYTPNSFFFGTDSFTYRVRDPFFVGNTVTVTLLVEPAPVAGDDFYSAGFGQWLEIGVPGVLANDVNLAGGPLTAELVTGPNLGQLQFQANGSFRYLPGNNYNVVDSFTYRARTASGYLSNLATVYLQITPPAPPPPTAVNDTFSGFQGVPLVIASPGLLANDVIPAGAPVTAVQFTGPANGLLGLLPTGGFTYAPNAGFVGADSFTYRLLRDGVFSNVATVTLQINAGVAPPVALPDAFGVQRDTLLTVNAPGLLGNDTDPQGLTLTAVLQVGPQHGVLNLNGNGSFTYSPTAGFTGPDQFSYRAYNGTQFSGVTTVNLTVTPPALPPTAHPDNYFTQVGVALNVGAALGVLANDSDPQGLPLTAELTGPLPADVGVLSLNPDGSFSFTPAVGFVGIALFNYRATNGVTPPSAATSLQISVTPTPGDPARRVVVAPHSGMEPRVKVFDGGTGAEVASFLAYEASFQGGVRVATADVTGDGIADIITAPGAGRAPHVKVFDGATFQQLAGTRGSFLAYTASFTGGVFVAAGDVNGDGTPDIVTGPDAGSLATTVRVFNGKTGAAFSGVMGGFTAYASSYKGGVRVAAADLNGDGRADIITAPGAGTISGNQTGQVRSFDLSRKQPGNTKLPFVLQQFSPYGTSFAGGVYVATGDVDGDGRAEVITGSGAGMVGSVKIYAPNSTVPSRSFTPLAGFTGGVRVAAGDVNGDGLADILVGTGPGTPSRVRSFDAVTLAELFTALVPFDPNFQGGLNLAGRG